MQLKQGIKEEIEICIPPSECVLLVMEIIKSKMVNEMPDLKRNVCAIGKSCLKS